MLAPASPLATSPAPSASVVVMADVDVILRHDGIPTLADVRQLLDELSAARLVLYSSRRAVELRALQRALGIREPFIASGGAELHIPQGYFCPSADTSGEAASIAGDLPDEYETIDFGVPRPGHAIRLLIALFRTCPVVPRVVGIGFEWRDRVLLREVDVPVVIRDPAVDQSGLLRNVPHAYVADTRGDVSLAEVVLRHGSVARA